MTMTSNEILIYVVIIKPDSWNTKKRRTAEMTWGETAATPA